MHQLSREAPPPDRALAVWAGACLGGTALAGVAAFLLLAAALSPLTKLLEHPLAIALTAVAAFAYITSLATLSRLGKAAIHLRRRQLWYRSLTCNVIVVGIVVSTFGAKGGLAGLELGLILCVMELVAIALHVVALSLRSVHA